MVKNEKQPRKTKTKTKTKINDNEPLLNETVNSNVDADVNVSAHTISETNENTISINETNDNTNQTADKPLQEPIKLKRGRKPKNQAQIISQENTPISSTVTEVIASSASLSKEHSEAGNIDLTIKDVENNCGVENKVSEKTVDENDVKQIGKKRGRKPKGGKIIQHLIPVESQKVEKPNVILHLKCSIKDLQNTSGDNTFIESFNFSNKHELNYEMISTENIKVNNFTTIEKNNNQKKSFTKETNDYDYDYDDENDKDDNREVWKKLKQLEHNLHINNVNNKRSACFWDTCDFDNPPVYIPKHFINGTYHVYGCFCSPECAVAHLMNEPIDSSTKFERYHLLNHIYSKIYDYKKNIKPAPNPFYMLEKYYGNLSTQEYRSLLRNERLFLIVDKPLTRILPELHEDNDDFILNNKIIPSNSNYQLKTRLQRKKMPKTTIFNEKFGMSSVAETAE